VVAGQIFTKFKYRGASELSRKKRRELRKKKPSPRNWRLGSRQPSRAFSTRWLIR
jgi:hypothetical protein